MYTYLLCKTKQTYTYKYILPTIRSTNHLTRPGLDRGSAGQNLPISFYFSYFPLYSLYFLLFPYSVSSILSCSRLLCPTSLQTRSCNLNLTFLSRCLILSGLFLQLVLLIVGVAVSSY